jgi:Ser-tRNA(Ala) deacylase AlaX
LEEEYSLTDPVTIEIDADHRTLCAKIHSKGHLIDMAVAALGHGDEFEPTRGYHFPDSPYVEYKITGAWGAEDRNKLMVDIHAKSNEIIQQGGHDTTHHFENGIRTIKLSEIDAGCPCLGTHVNHLAEVESITIRKIIKKGKTLRVAYI